MRGLCEGSAGYETVDAASIDAAFAQAVEVAFQAVRKPVEGTILTVLRDAAGAAKRARKKKLSTEEALEAVVAEAYASVQRTPDLLPVLKENGVVDAGGYGLAIFFDAFASALTGKEGPLGDELAFARGAAPKVVIEQINDWEGSAYRYCTEFLVHSDALDVDAAKEFLPTWVTATFWWACTPTSRCTCTRTAPTGAGVVLGPRGAGVRGAHPQHAAAKRGPHRRPGRRAARRAQAARLRGGGGRRGQTPASLESLGVDVVVSGGRP